MTHQIILKQAIEKAIKNGWNPDGFTMGTPKEKGKYIFKLNQTKPYQVRAILLSHDFAQAFWGNKTLWVRSCGHIDKYMKDKEGWPLDGHSCPDYDEGGSAYTQTAWKFHLQQMVIAKDPIKFLERYL